MKPVGTPFQSGMWERDRWVFAIQMGKFPNPWQEYKWKATDYCQCLWPKLVILRSISHCSNSHSVTKKRWAALMGAERNIVIFINCQSPHQALKWPKTRRGGGIQNWKGKVGEVGRALKSKKSKTNNEKKQCYWRKLFLKGFFLSLPAWKLFGGGAPPKCP